MKSTHRNDRHAGLVETGISSSATHESAFDPGAESSDGTVNDAPGVLEHSDEDKQSVRKTRDERNTSTEVTETSKADAADTSVTCRCNASDFLTHFGGGTANSENVRRTSVNQVSQRAVFDKWQKKHIAKAVVDNALNTTLSELGLVPEGNNLPSQSRQVESTGVLAAIQSKGLRGQSRLTTDIIQRLAPSVDQFSDTSERFAFGDTFSRVTQSASIASSEDLSDTHSVDSDTEAKPDAENVVDEAVSAAIAEKGLVLNSS